MQQQSTNQPTGMSYLLNDNTMQATNPMTPNGLKIGMLACNTFPSIDCQLLHQRLYHHQGRNSNATPRYNNTFTRRASSFASYSGVVADFGDDDWLNGV